MSAADDAAGEESAATLVGQKLQSVGEVYVYKIPPLKTAGGHRAEDWNLANPLKTCSLLVEQHGNRLHLLFRHLQNPEDPNSITLFAQSKIDLRNQLSLEYFVENVVDSSRYFVLRIVDDKSGREARIGFGFRDREEATDFRECLNYFVKSIKRQEEAAEVMHHYAGDLGSKNLSLQEGEKIHIHLGGGGGGGAGSRKSTITKTKTPDNKPKGSASSSPRGGGGGPFLLKKPPAAPKFNRDVSISFGDMDLNSAGMAGAAGVDDLSTGALGEASSGSDDDIWQDFEDANDNSEGGGGDDK